MGWAGDRSLLVVKNAQSTQASAYLLDVDTGEEKPLAGLTAAVRNPPAGTEPWYPYSMISPDGQWLLWGSISGNAPHRQFATRLDGSRTIEWKDNRPEQWGRRTWLPDSEGWTCPVLKLRLGMDVEIAEIQEFTLRDPHSVRHHKAGLTGFYPLGWMGLDKMISELDARTSPQNEARIQIASLSDSAPRVDRLVVRLPERSETTRVATAGRGGRLFLTALESDSNLWIKTVSLTTLIAGWDTWLVFWACAPDGSHLREIGRVRCMAQGKNEGYNYIGPSPSGRKVAFKFRGALYVAPVP
jgi:hypothetical protein